MPRVDASSAHAALGVPRAAVHAPVHAERPRQGPWRLPSVSTQGWEPSFTCQQFLNLAYRVF
jgi:hypothetical protein